MKTGTKELIKRVGAIHGFTGETNLFFLVPEDVSSEQSIKKRIETEVYLGNCCLCVTSKTKSYQGGTIAVEGKLIVVKCL